MWSSYTIDLYSPAGVHVQPIETWQSITLTRTVNAVGAMTIAIAYDPRLWSRIRKDSIFDVWRRASNGARKRVMDTVWLVAQRNLSLASDGTWQMTFTCVDCMDILRRWLVLTPMPATDPAWLADDWTGLSAGILVEACVIGSMGTSRGNLPNVVVEPNTDLGCGSDAGGSPMTYDPSNMSALSAIQAICQASTQAGYYLCVDWLPLSITTWSFQIYAGQRGTDRSPGSPVPLLLSAEGGDISHANYTEDYSSSVSYMVCGGQKQVKAVGTGATQVQITASATNTALESLGPFAHTEGHISSQNSIDTTGTLLLQAQHALRLHRPHIALSNATIMQTPSCEPGVHFDFGDMVSASFGPVQFTARIDSLTLSVDASKGQEQVTTSLVGELT